MTRSGETLPVELQIQAQPLTTRPHLSIVLQTGQSVKARMPALHSQSRHQLLTAFPAAGSASKVRSRASFCVEVSLYRGYVVQWHMLSRKFSH